MKLNIKSLLIFLGLTLSINSVVAQNRMEFYLGSGLPGIKYSGFKGKQSSIGVMLGAEYKHYISKGLSINSGLEYAYRVSKVKSPDFMYEYMVKDFQNDDVLFQAFGRNYNETHTIHMISIPLRMQYSFVISDEDNASLHVAGGIKLGFPISGTYRTYLNVETKGVFDKLGVNKPPYENLPHHGFGVANGLKHTGNLETKMNVSLNFELGYNFSLKDNDHQMYIGGFVDYGLTDMNKKGDRNIVEYHPTTVKAEKYNMFEVGYISSAKLYTIGIKVTYSLPMVR